MQTDADQKERHQQLGDSVGELGDASFRGLRQGHTCQKSADDGGHARIDGEQGERKQEGHGHRELALRQAQPRLHVRHDAAHSARAETRHEEGKAEGEAGGQRDVQVVDRALGHTADHSKHDQAKHVVDHRRGQDDPAGSHVEQPASGQYLGRNPHAGGDHSRTGEDTLQPRFAPESTDAPSREEGYDDSSHCHQQCGAAYLHQLGRLDLQSDAEEEEHYAQVGERPQKLGRRRPRKHLRTDEYAREDFTDDARLSETLEDLLQKFRRREDHEHCERDLGSRGHESIMDRRSNGPARESVRRITEWKWAGRRPPHSPG